jgi:peptidoglycan/LPS O-acetylase OafA/YrhL
VASTGGTTRDDRLPCLDGLRALAATSVAVYHAAFRTIDPLTPAGAVLHRLDLGVLLFFVISGFLLYQPFVARLHAGRGSPDLRRYALRRAIRIYPPYWLALTVTTYALGLVVLPSIGSVLTHYTLTHHYYPEYFFGQGLDQSWTLSIEISFYAALPLYAAAVAGLARATGVTVAEIVGLAAVIVVGMACQSATQYHATLPVWVRVLPINAPLFVFGMVLAVVSVRASEPGLPAWLDALARRPGLLAALAGLGFVAEIALLGRESALTWSPAQWIWRFVLGGLLSFFLVAIAVVGPQDVGLVRRVLRHPVVAWVGSVSYGVYLWHQTVLTLLFHGMLGGAKGLGPFLVLAATGVLLATAVAAASWYLVERPLLAWAHRR